MSSTGVPSMASSPRTSITPFGADGHQLAHRRADAVRARLGALGEDADLRPVGVAAWMAGGELDAVRVDAIEDEHDLDV